MKCIRRCGTVQKSGLTTWHIFSTTLCVSSWIHRKKKVHEFPVPSQDVTTKLSLGGNNDVITELFLPRGSLVSDIPAEDGKLMNLFLRGRQPP
jgi:hypothetical protein